MEENLNKNEEIGKVPEELNLEHREGEQQNVPDSLDVTKKAQEAFKEFELKQKTLREQQQKVIEVPKVDESLKFKGINEIEESLKKFEEKSVQEEQEKQEIQNPDIPKDASRMARLVMKLSGGLIREEKKAEYVLLSCAVLFFLASGYLFYLGIRGSAPVVQKPSPEMLNQMKQMQVNR